MSPLWWSFLAVGWLDCAAVSGSVVGDSGLAMRISEEEPNPAAILCTLCDAVHVVDLGEELAGEDQDIDSVFCAVNERAP